jgi:hypothetical protein
LVYDWIGNRPGHPINRSTHLPWPCRNLPAGLFMPGWSRPLSKTLRSDLHLYLMFLAATVALLVIPGPNVGRVERVSAVPIAGQSPLRDRAVHVAAHGRHLDCPSASGRSARPEMAHGLDFVWRYPGPVRRLGPVGSQCVSLWSAAAFRVRPSETAIGRSRLRRRSGRPGHSIEIRGAWRCGAARLPVTLSQIRCAMVR